MSKQSKICMGMGLLLTAAPFLRLIIFGAIRRRGFIRTGSRAAEPDIQENINMSLPDLPIRRVIEEAYIPDYVLNPEMDMPQEEVDGQEYSGVLTIPALSLDLPVIGEWSYSNLRTAPCRYAGSVYLNNMVIAAHNYRSHFGRLKDLPQGEEVIFTDMDGNVFRYRTAEMEILSPFAVEEMTSRGLGYDAVYLHSRWPIPRDGALRARRARVRVSEEKTLFCQNANKAKKRSPRYDD